MSKKVLTDPDQVIKGAGEIGRVLGELQALKHKSLTEAFIFLALGVGDDAKVVSGMEGPGVSCVSMLVDFFGNNPKIFWAVIFMMTQALQDPHFAGSYPDWCDKEELTVLTALIGRRMGEGEIQVKIHDQDFISDPNGRVGNA